MADNDSSSKNDPNGCTECCGIGESECVWGTEGIPEHTLHHRTRHTEAESSEDTASYPGKVEVPYQDHIGTVVERIISIEDDAEELRKGYRTYIQLKCRHGGEEHHHCEEHDDERVASGMRTISGDPLRTCFHMIPSKIDDTLSIYGDGSVNGVVTPSLVQIVHILIDGDGGFRGCDRTCGLVTQGIG